VPSARPSLSPIVRVLNQDVGRFHRWCTPSILPEQERVEDFYASDVSISAGFFGPLVEHTGIFGAAERFAAEAQGADRTMFSCMPAPYEPRFEALLPPSVDQVVEGPPPVCPRRSRCCTRRRPTRA
jgi:Orn/Lys/Arg decarboxylase, major domain